MNDINRLLLRLAGELAARDWNAVNRTKITLRGLIDFRDKGSIVVRSPVICWRCQLALEEKNRFDRHCPRCACDLDGEPYDIEEETQEQKDARRSWLAAKDLSLIYMNWVSGYIRNMEEQQQADYSALDDFIHEVVTISGGYFLRLQKEKILDRDGKEYVQYSLHCAINDLMRACEEWELLQRLSGSWDDNEEEIKQYWLARIRGFKEALPYDGASKAVKRIEADTLRKRDEEAE